MNLKEKITLDRLNALKQGNNIEKNLLGVLIGELDRKTKTPSDSDVIAVVKKMVENAKTLNNAEEINILEKYLPQMLSEIEIGEIVLANKFSNIGDCMKFFKENYSGHYDGKLLSDIFKKSTL